jgi:pre-mRNA-processing factor 6
MKSAVFERQQGQSELALKTVTTALLKYPKFAKLYMVQGQIHQAANNYSAARAAYAAGIKAVSKDITLRVLASRLEEADGKSIRARALLEKARLVNSKSDVLWAEAVRVEERSGAPAQGKALLARALQECPTSGILWSMAIWSEARPQRKARSVDALRKCEADPLVICTVARLYWADRRIEKAREWFERAVSAGPGFGDGWGWWLKFERQHGMAAQQEDVIVRCQAAEPRHGETWQPIAKDDKNGGKSAKEIVELVAAALQ